MKAWIVQKTDNQRGETVITDVTTVYAANQIDATRQGITLLGTSNVTVTEIPAEHGGNVPSDQEIAEGWREIIAERGDDNPETVNEMRSAGGSAYE